MKRHPCETVRTSCFCKREHQKKQDKPFGRTEIQGFRGGTDDDSELNLWSVRAVMRIYRTSHVLLHGYLRNVTREESLGRPFSGEQRADRRPDVVVACLKAFAVVRACNRRPRAVRRLTATWASFSPERAIFHLLKLSQLKEAVNGGQGRRRFIVPTKRSSPHGEDKHRMDCTNGLYEWTS